MLTGEALAHPNLPNIIHDIALLNSLGVRLVLVQGARPQIEQRVAQQGLSSFFHNHLRVTTSQTLRCVQEAAGALRCQLEALLSMGVANSPMHGSRIRVCGGNFVTAKPLGVIDGIDYQHTGEVRRVDRKGIKQQLDNGNVVLLPCLGYSPTGEVFNLSTEDVATQVAHAISADKLVLFSSEQGVLEKGGLIKELCLSDAKLHIQSLATDHANLLPLKAAINACEAGIERSHIVSYAQDGALLKELFTREGSGTLITREHYETIRSATIDDVGGILELLKPLEEDGILVRRSREILETEICNFVVIERDGMIIGCSALYPYQDQGELACVAVHVDYRHGNRGDALLSYVEKAAAKQGLNTLFVLTTRTAHWFQERGFITASAQTLPKAKQALYNYQRNSNVFEKTL
jgi:amino-acid N-acetyltransferase